MQRALMNTVIKVMLLILVSFLFATQAKSQIPSFESRSDYMHGRVVEVIDQRNVDSQKVRIKIIAGDEKNKEIIVDYGTSLMVTQSQRLEVGDLVSINRITAPDGQISYYITDRYRLTPLIITGIIFFAVVVFFGRLKGFTSILGLAIGLFVLFTFFIPGILNGDNPLILALVSASAIAITSLYVAHGFNKRTSIALVSTLITLIITTALAYLAVSINYLSGTGSEEALFLRLGSSAHINLRGLLLGGIIIGALGVLDDVTTTQVATIAELKKANPKYKFRQLYSAGINVGREHIASLINTLVLAYAGASLPLFLLFFINNNEPIWVTLNSEFIVEEIVRTLVGSTALILAVPISTYLAAHFYTNTKSKSPASI